MTQNLMNSLLAHQLRRVTAKDLNCVLGFRRLDAFP